MSSIKSNPIKVSVADVDIQKRNYYAAAPDFQKFQSDGVAFAKLAEFFAMRMDDHCQRRDDLRRLVDGQLKQSLINLAVENHMLMPRLPQDGSPD